MAEIPAAGAAECRAHIGRFTSSTLEYPLQDKTSSLPFRRAALGGHAAGKLAKARQLKQGMMQELLTGRIRLL